MCMTSLKNTSLAGIASTLMVFTLAGCASHSPDTQRTQSFNTSHIFNSIPEHPNTNRLAANYCLTQGGQLEVRKMQTGEEQLCHLPDGKSVDAWQYYAEQHATRH